MRVLLFTGKGGVGKTTVAAAARSGGSAGPEPRHPAGVQHIRIT